MIYPDHARCALLLQEAREGPLVAADVQAAFAAQVHLVQAHLLPARSHVAFARNFQLRARLVADLGVGSAVHLFVIPRYVSAQMHLIPMPVREHEAAKVHELAPDPLLWPRQVCLARRLAVFQVLDADMIALGYFLSLAHIGLAHVLSIVHDLRGILAVHCRQPVDAWG